MDRRILAVGYLRVGVCGNGVQPGALYFAWFVVMSLKLVQIGNKNVRLTSELEKSTDQKTARVETR